MRLVQFGAGPFSSALWNSATTAQVPLLNLASLLMASEGHVAKLTERLQGLRSPRLGRRGGMSKPGKVSQINLLPPGVAHAKVPNFGRAQCPVRSKAGGRGFM